jgi:hypothetical protein
MWGYREPEADDTRIHVVPLADLIAHEESEDCVCRPELRLVTNDDLSDGCWVITHHSLDGRELNEPDYGQADV